MAPTLVLNPAGRKMESLKVLNQPILICFLTISLMFSVCGSEPYDYMQYVVQWQPAVCSTPNYHRQKCRKLAKPEFTIHGLWPSKFSGAHVIYCRQQDAFHINKVHSIRAELNKCWPDLLPDVPHRYSAVCSRHRGNAGFWCREWQKHGICSLFNQREYFNRAVELCTTYNKKIEYILQRNQILASNTRLVKSINISDTIYEEFGRLPALRCSLRNDYLEGPRQLLEVILCFTVDGKYMIDCPQSIIDRPQSIRYCPSDIFFLSSATDTLQSALSWALAALLLRVAI
ncbi:hypothetical protein SLEP1_g1502 [Rubroshorea leprosula]|uniref:Uncharacterized protein n=1 Tax=Rubroshorea leprosula TaxID=152421 RepID=A0AAV5HMR6_9ROSI|nr:hypothetical protein SLEP1_g1502 [Rubroshorea leprosula]